MGKMSCSKREGIRTAPFLWDKTKAFWANHRHSPRTVTAIALTGFVLLLGGCASDEDRACSKAAEVFEQTLWDWEAQSVGYNRSAFFSQRYAGCFYQVTHKVKNDFRVFDLSGAVLSDLGPMALLFICDQLGADSPRLDMIAESRGRVYHLAYGSWLDDGLGGPPRTLQTASPPLTRSDCAARKANLLGELRR
jgi:hypothetical protein